MAIKIHKDFFERVKGLRTLHLLILPRVHSRTSLGNVSIFDVYQIPEEDVELSTAALIAYITNQNLQLKSFGQINLYKDDFYLPVGLLKYEEELYFAVYDLNPNYIKEDE